VEEERGLKLFWIPVWFEFPTVGNFERVENNRSQKNREKEIRRVGKGGKGELESSRL